MRAVLAEVPETLLEERRRSGAEVQPDADGGVTLFGVRIAPRPGRRPAGISIERDGRRFL